MRANKALVPSAALSLGNGADSWATPRRIALLAAIAEHGSLTQAARAVGLSYKGAWDALELMQARYGQTLVQRSAGGRGGGSSVLTEEGSALTARYAELAALHGSYVQRLGQIAQPSAALDKLRALRLQSSAQNQFYGWVLDIAPGAVQTEVALGLEGGAVLYAMLARQSVAELELAPGHACFALVQASDVLLARGMLQLSARNQLKARVAQIERGAVNAQLRLTLSQGGEMKSTVSLAALDGLALRRGSTVSAVFEASAVIVGTFL